MPNDVRFGLPISVSLDWLSSRFIAFGLPAGQDEKGQSDCLALPCCIAAQQRSSRSSALLYPLLGNRDFITRSLCRTKMGSFSIIKWSPFR
jgi:hypothetical protein